MESTATKERAYLPYRGALRGRQTKVYLKPATLEALGNEASSVRKGISQLIDELVEKRTSPTATNKPRLGV